MSHQYIVFVRDDRIQKIIETTRFEKEKTIAALTGSVLKMPGDLQTALVSSIGNADIWRITSDYNFDYIQNQNLEYPSEFLEDVKSSGVQIFKC